MPAQGGLGRLGPPKGAMRAGFCTAKGGVGQSGCWEGAGMRCSGAERLCR
jgi:hypothetical protein